MAREVRTANACVHGAGPGLHKPLADIELGSVARACRDDLVGYLDGDSALCEHTVELLQSLLRPRSLSHSDVVPLNAMARHTAACGPFTGANVDAVLVLAAFGGGRGLGRWSGCRARGAVTVRGHFPTEEAALNTLYVVTRGLDPKGSGQALWAVRWKPALNAFYVNSPTACPRAETL